MEADVASFVRTTNAESDPPRVVVGDMICDLLHWLENKTGEGLEVVHAARSGVANYLSESEALNASGEMPGPDVAVTIRAVSEGHEYSFLIDNETELQPILDGS